MPQVGEKSTENSIVRRGSDLKRYMQRRPMNSYKYPIALAITLLLWACTPTPQPSSAPAETDCLPPTLTDLLPLLGQRLQDLSAFPCMAIADTILDSDEGVSWPAKAARWKGEAAFLAEAAWDDHAHVQRITVSHSLIRLGEIHVGQTFADIRAAVDEDMPVSPDGYLFVQSKADSRINIQLDISRFPFDAPISRGELEVAQLPGDLRVAAIVMQ